MPISRLRWLLFTVLIACSSETDDPVCSDSTSCETNGETCSTATERCTCALAHWACEPTACPVGAAVEGEACTTAGLRCDTGFEDAGSICVGPELTWARCRNYHQAASGGGPPNNCPASAPSLGTACCQALSPGSVDLGCVYGPDVIDCVNNHWVQR